MTSLLRPWIRFTAIILLLAGMGTHVAAALPGAAEHGPSITSAPPPGHEAIVSEPSLPRTLLRQEKDPTPPPVALQRSVRHAAAVPINREWRKRPSTPAFGGAPARVLPPPLGPPLT